MALDGIFLSKLRDELKNLVIGLRVDKVNQPTKDEIVLTLRGKAVHTVCFAVSVQTAQECILQVIKLVILPHRLCFVCFFVSILQVL